MTQWLPHSKLSARFEARAGGRGHARDERGIYAASTHPNEEGDRKSIAVINGTLKRAEARAHFADSNASVHHIVTDSLTLLRLGFTTAALRSSLPA